MAKLRILLHKQAKKIKKFFQTPFKVHLRNVYLKIKPFLTWRMFPCIFIAWMITSGWSWLFIAFGSWLNIKWMLSVGLGYQAILWMPWTAEKIITVAIALWLYRLIYREKFVIVKISKEQENL